MKVLVTGGTGFIGSHLAKALVAEGHDVRCLVRESSDLQRLHDSGVELVYGDILETNSIDEALCGIDIVYHLAGILGQWGIPDETYWAINVQGTKNMLETSLKHNIKRFIHCSTAGVTGPTLSISQDESFPYNPSNIYELTKAKGEKLALQFYRDAGLPVVVIRPEFIYGPGDTHTFGLFKTIQRRVFILIDGGKATWHPTYIDDLVQGFQCALSEPRAIGQIYIIAGERYVTIKDLSYIIADSLGVSRPKISIPKNLALVLAYSIQKISGTFGLDSPLTTSMVKTFCRSSGCSIEKAKNEIGYKPQITLEEGLQRTANWYKCNGWY
jgi:nucleoside-diphosphate-sugar epimerase